MIKKAKKQLLVCLSEDSIQERRAQLRFQNALSMPDLEIMHIFHSINGLCLPIKPRMTYEGSSASKFVGPVALPSWSGAWQLTYREKKALYDKFRIAVGGKDDASGAGPDVKVNEYRKSEDKEPVFYHTLPVSYYREMIHCLQWKAVIHLSAGDGALALACHSAQIPYLGVCLSEVHATELYRHLEKERFRLMHTEGDEFCIPELLKIIVDTNETTTPEKDDKPKPAQSQKRQRKPKAKAKAARKKEAEGEEGEDDDADGENPDGEDEDGEEKEDPPETPIAKRLKTALSKMRAKKADEAE